MGTFNVGSHLAMSLLIQRDEFALIYRNVPIPPLMAIVSSME